MRFFWAMLTRAFKIMMIHKWIYIINILLRPLMIAIVIFVYQAIYAYDGRQIIIGYTCTQMIWYYVGVTFFYSFVWCTPDKEVSDEIISGGLAVRLLKPISFLKATFINAAAFLVVNFLVAFIPTFICNALIVYPDFFSFAAFMKYLVMNSLAFILFYLFSFLIGTAAFKLENTSTLQLMKAMVMVFGGLYIPYDFLPGFLQSWLKALPFQYVYYTPIQFFLNKPETQSMSYFWNTVLILSAWIVAFYILSVNAWRMGLKKFYAAGG